MTILDTILAHKQLEVADRRRHLPLPRLRALAEACPPALDFVASLRRSPARPALIAEIKRASPSRGLLTADFDPLRLADIYAHNGAAAISVLTDERFFQGHLDHLRLLAGHRPRLPLLCKDFLCDPYQVYEARAAGADAVLLIAAALPPGLLRDLHALARELGMATLVEVHTGHELEAALANGYPLIGINNRNLHDFSISLETTCTLAPRVPAEICLVSESGIRGAEDVARLASVPRADGEPGVDAILVGEALVTAADVAAQVRQLSGVDRRTRG